MQNLQVLNALAYRATRDLIQQDEVGGVKSGSREQEYMTGVLEALVDRYGLSVTISALADVAESKADHVRERWQDKPLAASWCSVAIKLNAVALAADNALKSCFRPIRVLNATLNAPFAAHTITLLRRTKTSWDEINEWMNSNKGGGKMNAKPAFTPGPWVQVPQSDGSKMIAHEYETGKQMNPKGLRIVCFVPARNSSLSEDEANACLIAAAPELWRACMEVIEANDYDTIEAAKESAREALAKVEYGK